jgi:hypothetical protein
VSSLILPSTRAIAGFAADKPLSDPSLPSSPVSLGLRPSFSPVNLPDPANPAVTLGSFTISADEQACVAIINSSSDPDPEGYLNLGGGAQQAAEDAAEAPIIEAPIAYDPGLAYVVITGLSVTGKVAGTFTIGGPASLGLNGSIALDAGACMAFPGGSMAYASLAAAATNFRTVFSLAELLSPAPAPPCALQVLSFGVQAGLGLSLTLTAASMATTVADSLAAVLGQTGPFSFTAGPSATVTVSASATDGFRVFAQRAAGGTLFSVKKSVSTCIGLNAGIGLTVSVADADLDALVDSVLDQAAGASAGTVQSLLAAADASAPALIGIVGKLGLPTTPGGQMQSLQNAWASMEADLTQRIVAVVTAQFTYSWQRLTTQSLAAQFTVPDAALPKYHASVLRLDLTRLMTEGKADGVVFSRILGQKVGEVDVGYGFSFGIAGYTFLKSWDSLKQKFVELDSTGSDGGSLRQYSFLGKRAYEASWLDSKQDNYVELDASTTAPKASPDASDFQVGLSVAFSWTGRGFQGILDAVADHGAIIGALDPDVATAAQSLVAAGLPLDATGDALVSLVISDAVLRQLLPILTGNAYRQSIAPYAMARALPYYGPYAERRQVDVRTNAYSQVFADFLATQAGTLQQDTVGRLCGLYLAAPNASTGLASSESGEDVGWTAQNVVASASQDDLQDAVVNRVPCCFSLLQARTGDFRTVFPSCVSDFSELAGQAYGTRIFASMLFLAAGVNPEWQGRIPRFVRLGWKDEKGTHTIVTKQGT